MSTYAVTRPVHTPWIIVAKREIMAQLTDKAFWIGTASTIGLLIVGFFVGGWLSGGPGDAKRVAVASDDAIAIVELARADGTPVEAVRVEPSELAPTVARGDADAALSFSDGKGWELAVKNFANAPSLEGAVRTFQIEHNASAHGIDPADILAGTTLDLVSVDGDQASALAMTVATFAFAILFMMVAMTYGMQISQSVVTEKESRIVEILAAAVPVRHLLIGKVVGNSIMALGQVVLIVATALVGMSFTEFKSMIGVVAPVSGWFTLFFLIGFASLACLWAAVGAMATRMQDLGQTTAPLMMVVMLVYMLGMFASGTMAQVLSYVPVASVVVMPGRLLNGDASWIDALLSLAASVAFMAIAIWVGERIYRRGLLQTGSVMKFKDAFAKAD
ncbi:MAG: ABC transporter permease [Propioniciclava sp.]|uniref:ABC transporter permease n=1 Tax=Propioniciclava sp. TaxID=2038686 RepID=UPI0039E3822D